MPAVFLLGLAVGGASVTVPTYLAEMSPAERRGRIVTQNELMIVSGQLLAFIFNAILGTMMGDSSHVWRYMLAIASLPAILLFFGMIRLPESPRWLVSKNKNEEALNVLKRIRKMDEAESEFQGIRATFEKENHVKKATFKDLNVPWIRRIVFLGIGIAIVQQITGVNSIMYYGTQILKDAGFETKAALIGNIANGIISVLATFFFTDNFIEFRSVKFTIHQVNIQFHCHFNGAFPITDCGLAPFLIRTGPVVKRKQG